MPAKNARQTYTHMAVSVRQVIVPDAEMRLSRAIDILLENAARNQNPPAGSRKHSKEKPHTQISDQGDFGVRK